MELTIYHYLATTIIGILICFVAIYKLSDEDKFLELVLNPKEFKQFPLIHKEQLSHNTALFGLPHNDIALCLPIGQVSQIKSYQKHISIMIEQEGKQILRSYTPTSTNEIKGHFDLTYEQGVISKYLSELNLGDKINVRGPKGNFNYTENMVREFGMIAGGTGITPMYQIINFILNNPSETTKLKLIYANVNIEDILLKQELDILAKKFKNRFTVFYVLNNKPKNWTQGVGFVNKDHILEYCPSPANDIKILICGPPPMVKGMCAICEELGYNKPKALSKTEDMIFKF